jgi:hypothetical protein
MDFVTELLLRAARSGPVRAAFVRAELKVERAACQVVAVAWVASLGRLLGIVRMPPMRTRMCRK